MTTLTHKDKLHLNRRARAHGLPDLWPEAEELAKRFHHQMRGSYERALYSATTARSSGWPGLTFFAVDPSSQRSSMGAWQGGVEGLRNMQPSPWMEETAAEAMKRFRREGGLTTPRKGFLHWLFG